MFEVHDVLTLLSFPLLLDQVGNQILDFLDAPVLLADLADALVDQLFKDVLQHCPVRIEGYLVGLKEHFADEPLLAFVAKFLIGLDDILIVGSVLIVDGLPEVTDRLQHELQLAVYDQVIHQLHELSQLLVVGFDGGLFSVGHGLVGVVPNQERLCSTPHS